MQNVCVFLLFLALALSLSLSLCVPLSFHVCPLPSTSPFVSPLPIKSCECFIFPATTRPKHRRYAWQTESRTVFLPCAPSLTYALCGLFTSHRSESQHQPALTLAPLAHSHNVSDAIRISTIFQRLSFIAQ